MAKTYEGIIQVGFPFEVQTSKPIDDRFVVDTFNDLLTLDYTYPGIPVYVKDQQISYTRIGVSSSIGPTDWRISTTSGNSFTGSFSGSFYGDGSHITNIPASSVTGLNLSQISSGSYSASISPNGGMAVNTYISASSFTGSLYGTASNAVSSSYSDSSISSSYASLSNIQYVTSSLELLSQIEVADYSADVAVTFTNGKLKFIFGTPTVPSAPALSFNSTFATDRFNAATDNYDITGSININGYNLVSASLYEGYTLLNQVGGVDSKIYYNTTTTGSHTYSLAVTGSSPLDGTINIQTVSLSGTLAKVVPAVPSITPTPVIQLGATSNQIEQGATGSISFTSSAGAANSWILGALTTSPVSSPISVTDALTGSAAISITSTTTYTAPSPNIDTTSNKVTTVIYSKIRSLRYGVSNLTTIADTQTKIENISTWDTTLGGNIGTIVKGTLSPVNQTFTITTSGQYIYIVYDSAQADLTGILNVNNSNSNDLSVFTKTLVGNYKVYRSNNLSSTTILYKLT